MFYNKIFDYKSLFRKDESLSEIQEMFFELKIIENEQKRMELLKQLRKQVNDI